jgi:sugar phosphate isomerase/epimerase
MSIQLQPQSVNLEQWVLLARKESAAFEVMDPFSLSSVGDFGKHEKIAEQFQKTGIAKSMHGAFIDVNPASSDPDFRQLSRQRCRESCEIASALGAVNVVFHSSAFPFLRGAYLENWAADCASFYTELAAQYPVRICIENAQDLDPTPLRKLMEHIDSDRIGVCLDIGHIHYSRIPVGEWFEQLGQWVQYLHLSDNMGSFDDHLPLGQGSIDWDLVNGLWNALRRDIPITLETGNLVSTRESIRFLRRHGYFGLKGNVNEKF